MRCWSLVLAPADAAPGRTGRAAILTAAIVLLSIAPRLSQRQARAETN